jgi:hypothetical protein
VTTEGAVVASWARSYEYQKTFQKLGQHESLETENTAEKSSQRFKVLGMNLLRQG